MKSRFPKVSIVIPTYNEETRIAGCLEAIIRQHYPQASIEVIVVDNGSVDETLEIVRDYRERYENICLMSNDTAKDAEISKMIGLRAAKGELFLYLDADIEIVGEHWLDTLVKPLNEDISLVGSFPRFIPKPEDTAIGRYLRCHPLELDPVFQFFCTPIKETVIGSKGDYQICEFRPPRVPPIGICIYRTGVLAEAIGEMSRFMDVDVPVTLSRRGLNRFAYVPSCGIYHANVKSLRELLRKRTRNIEKIYLPNLDTREFTYFNLGKKQDLLRIVFWIIWANLFVPLLLRSVWRSVRKRDLVYLYDPVVALVLTNGIAWEFLRSGQGRRVIARWIAKKQEQQ